MATRVQVKRRLVSVGVGAGVTGSLVLGLAVWGPVNVSQAFGTGGATRTWVSGVGDDANPCSRTAPCKTFAGAISKTAAGGEIDALDPGGFGAVTITKAITIVGVGTNASILTSGTAGVIVNAGAGDDVVLRNISLIGGAQCDGTQVAGSVHGVRYLAGRSLHLQNVDISEYPNAGIGLEPSAGVTYPVHVTLDNVNAHNICGAGLKSAAGAATVTTTITRSLFEHDQNGIRNTGGSISVSDSTFANNTVAGLWAGGGSGRQELSIAGSLIAGNANGVQSDTGGTVQLGSSSLTNNTNGLVPNGGTLTSFGDNTASGNGTDGSPTGTAGHL